MLKKFSVIFLIIIFCFSVGCSSLTDGGKRENSTSDSYTAEISETENAGLEEKYTDTSVTSNITASSEESQSVEDEVKNSASYNPNLQNSSNITSKEAKQDNSVSINLSGDSSTDRSSLEELETDGNEVKNDASETNSFDTSNFENSESEEYSSDVENLSKSTYVKSYDNRVSLSIEEGTLDSRGVTVLITNHTEEEMTYDKVYSLERKIGDEWYRLNEGQYFTAIGIIHKPNSTREYKIEFEKNLSEGHYRIVKKIGTASYDVEFEIKGE